jgi:signal transduction histidine kinase
MSHELRTPLNAVIGFADAMHSEMLGPLGNKRYGEYAAAIVEAGGRLLGMITNILDVAKIESGRLEIAPEDVDVARLAAECVGLVKTARAETDSL